MRIDAAAKGRRAINSEGVPAPSGPYSHAVVADGLVFLAGQRPVAKGADTAPEGFREQVDQALDNVQEILAEAGCTLSDIVKITAYLGRLEDFAELNRAFRDRLSEPFPARTTVGASLRDVLVELDVWAAIPQTDR